MPELPEVETIRLQLEPQLQDAEIVDGGSHWSAKFTPALEAVGTQINTIRRRGKYLLLGLTSGYELIIHLGMTGRLALRQPHKGQLDHPHLRAWWMLDNGSVLTFHDIRRFGRVYVVQRGNYAASPTLANLGPEPWDPTFTARSLFEFVKKSNRHLKTLLLSQRPVAGLGNIYADEALWLAKINPATRTLSLKRAQRLVDGIQTSLASGLSHGGTTIGDYVDTLGQKGKNQHELHCYGRAGEPCERCSNVLARNLLDARSTTWCRTCQPR